MAEEQKPVSIDPEIMGPKGPEGRANKKQAEQMAIFLNENNDWKLKDNEIYFTYEIDCYDAQPLYKLKSTKNKIN
jgi:hypothetical protein